MAFGTARLPTFHGRSFTLSAWTAGAGSRRVPMVRAVPGYGLTMTLDQMDASSGVDKYRLVTLSGGRPDIADIKAND